MEFLTVRPSQFLVGYWDASFKVFNEKGHEIEGPLLVAISEETGQVYNMDDLILQNMNNHEVKISNKPMEKGME